MANKIGLKHYIYHGLFFIAYGIVKYIPSPIGDVLRRLTTTIFGNSFKGVRIYEGVTLWYPYNIKIGTNTTLNEWVYLNGFGEIQIGSGVRIGHRTSIISSDHNIPKQGETFLTSGLSKGKVVIGDNVFIGCNVTILKGVSIGSGSVVAAGAVVAKEFPPNCIIGGVPAKVLSHIET